MITPMELQNHKFTLKWKGFDQEEVKHFLYAISEDFANLIEKNHKMAQELAVLRERLKDMEARDMVLKDTLVTAQQLKVEVHENAEKEADLIVKEAQLKADSFYEEAKQEVERVRRQMLELRRVRNDLLAETEMMVTRFSHFVEAEREVAVESDKFHNFAVRTTSKPAVSPVQPVKTAAPTPRRTAPVNLQATQRRG